MLVKHAYELVGNTPLIELTSIEKNFTLLEQNRDKNIVVLFPDSGDRYLWTPLFEE